MPQPLKKWGEVAVFATPAPGNAISKAIHFATIKGVRKSQSKSSIFISFLDGHLQGSRRDVMDECLRRA